MKSGSKSGDINPMVPGQKVTAIFGFCDIRQFTDATEVLQVRQHDLHISILSPHLIFAAIFVLKPVLRGYDGSSTPDASKGE